MNPSSIDQDGNGLWRASAWPGHADLLLAAIDPQAAFVMIETSDGNSDWHEAAVSIEPDEQPRRRILRNHRFDLLVTPAEAIAVGTGLRAQGVVGGGLACYQFHQQPRADFRLPEGGHARADAMRGQGVELLIDLPHDGEVAVVWSPIKSTLESFLGRLA